MPQLSTNHTNECAVLHTCINYTQQIKTFMLCVYAIQRQNKVLNYAFATHLCTTIPFELIRELYAYIYDPIVVGRYYSIMDNFNYTNGIQKYSIYTKIKYSIRPRYFIGKVIGIHPIHHTYLISYIDWDTSFNEYVAKEQISYLDYACVAYLIDIKIGHVLDCYYHSTNKWFPGICTHIHYNTDNLIIAIDTISLVDKHIYIYRTNIPIYSTLFARRNTHYLYQAKRRLISRLRQALYKYKNNHDSSSSENLVICIPT